MLAHQAAYSLPVALSVLACAVVLVLVWRRRHATGAVKAFAHSVLAHFTEEVEQWLG